MAKTASAKKRSESKDLEITRVYDAPVKAVWDAWTDPAQAAHWWGPRGFTITTHSKDLRPGGMWSYTMHGPDGTDYPNTTVYYEVEKYAKLVYDHGGHADTPPLFRVTVLFSEARGKTTMYMRMTCPTPEEAAATRVFVKKASGNSTWDRLDEYLAKHGSGEERFVINREFDAPIADVFEMWAEPKHLAQWLPPTGARMEILRSQGDTVAYVMTSGSDEKMYGQMTYKEKTPPQRIVYTQMFCDADGAIARHPLVPTWPEVMLTTVEFAEQAPDCTRVTVTWRPHGAVSAAELETFVTMRGNMTQGWTGSFDKLEAYFASK